VQSYGRLRAAIARTPAPARRKKFAHRWAVSCLGWTVTSDRRVRRGADVGHAGPAGHGFLSSSCLAA
jgi:hypothetical protein